tara:strand:- start:157 stop:2106 length:1950 start_codon:yes stop_codon:yes gene_type:complete
MALPNTIEIKFTGDSTELTTAIKSLDKATKSLINSQAKLVDKERKGSSTKEKHKKQVEALIISVKALGGQWSKNSTLLSLHRKALKGDKVAMQQLRNETRKYITTLGMAKKGMLETAHSTRILGGSFAVLRSKLLLVAFATLLIKNTIGKLVSAQGEQELAEKKLSSAIGRRSTELLKFASIQQKATTYGDEETITAMSLIGAYTDNEEAIKSLTKASMDLASAKGMDLATATDLVAKSVFSSTNALSRYGVTVEGNVGSTDRLNMAVKALGNMYGGQSQAQANTMTGALKQSGNAIGDTAEALGKLLSPAIVSMSKMFTGASEAVTGYVDALRLSNTELKGIIDTETREEVILAKIARLKNQIAESDASDRGHTAIFAKKKQELIDLEEQLALTRQGNFFEFNEADKEHITRLGVQHGLLLKTEAIESRIAVDRAINAEQQAQDQEDLFNIWNDESLALEDVAVNANFVNEIIAKQGKLYEDTRVTLNDQGLEIAKNDKAKIDSMHKERASMIMTASLNQKSAKDTMKAVLRAEMGKATAVLITKILSRFPFPLNLAMATGAGALASGLFDATVQKFAKGGDFVTDRPELIMVGEAGREHVQITPVDRPEDRALGGGGLTVNIMGGIVQEDYVTNELLPAINRARALA